MKEYRDKTAIYHLCYRAMEVFYLVISILHFYFTPLFIGEKYTTFGLDVLLTFILKRYEMLENPLELLFPTMANCEFDKGIGFGNVQTFKAFKCTLSMNELYQKVFLTLWFWFSFLIFLNTWAGLRNILQLCYWLISCAMKREYHPSTNFFLSLIKANVENITYTEFKNCLQSEPEKCKPKPKIP